MRVAITGSTGLVGTALIPRLQDDGHEVLSLVRRESNSDNEISWDPANGEIDAEALEGVDAVVHLAGENIAGGRWNDKMKQRLVDSRLQGTRLLAEALAGLTTKPKVLVCASAIGFYGDRGDELCTEDVGPGDNFLAGLCEKWEAASQPAAEAGIRVVNLRIGMVLSSVDGALKKMITPFKLGAGGVVGSGKQYWSWIHRIDLARVIEFCLNNEHLSGPVNSVAPDCQTNYDFTKTLGGVIKRPTIFPMPAFAARLALGGMADELLLASARVTPKKLEEANFQFEFGNLKAALTDLLVTKSGA